MVDKCGLDPGDFERNVCPKGDKFSSVTISFLFWAISFPLSRCCFIFPFFSPTLTQGPLEVVREQREGTRECFYLFELDSSAVCPVIESHLSTGSIILIMYV